MNPTTETPAPGPTDAELADEAISLATALLTWAGQQRAGGERRRLRRLGAMVEDPAGKAFTLALTDQVLRVRQPARAARRFHGLVAEMGVPDFPGLMDRLALRAGAHLAPRVPRLVMPLVTARIRREGAGVVLPAEDGPFSRHVRRRTAQGIHLNVNVLGEAILGEDEAARRAAAVRAELARPDVDYVSVKISALSSQVDPWAFDETVTAVAARLRPLYQEAARHRPPKFVNLDMEEFRDLGLTVAVFERVLDEPEFRVLDAGIVLQAYLPDSAAALVDLAEWAHRRREAGGGRTKVRIVKGANLAMEAVDAEMHGWPQAPFVDKAAVDANFKRMLDHLLLPRYADSLRVGVASHNLFDVAWALVVRDAAGAADRVIIEMLEGMAESQARATRAVAGDLLLYAPVARRDDIESSIAYLARRLDENTGPENFLRHLFTLRPGSPTFDRERDKFLAAVAARRDPVVTSLRTQDRSTEDRLFSPDEPFANEPDTDFALPANRSWMAGHLAAWEAGRSVPVVVAGRPVPGLDEVNGVDPSDPGAVPYRWSQADVATVDRAVAAAAEAGHRWAASGWEERRVMLRRVARSIAAGRGDAIAAMVRDAGKTVAQADPEVSEAVDFARYAVESTRLLESLGDVAFTPRGTVVVAPPWNFPFSIPAGGVLTALAGGNAVILKPAPETVLTAWVLVERCWEAGVPRDLLQFLPCADDAAGRRLITHPGVDAVLLTGAYETARMFRSWRPGLHLQAETSGKNAIVVTAAADLDAAVRDVVVSAFGHAGQKCSAASLVIVEGSVLDDGAFLRQLADATRSLRTGPSIERDTRVGPLIRPPEGPLQRALRTLDPGEQWLVEPTPDPANPRLWSPGVRLGVVEGSWFHRTECFGPVLGVMRAGDLAEAVRLQNGTDFGLTGGIESLDRDEVAYWLERVEVGNAYVNRPITGAIVRRQPFGGWKRSSFGPGAKAGGPNHLLALVEARPAGAPEFGDASVPVAVRALIERVGGRLSPRDRATVEAAAQSMAHWNAAEFSPDHDPSGLRAEADVFRYRPLGAPVLVRTGAGADVLVAVLAVVAATTADAEVAVSAAEDGPWAELGVPVTVESDAALASRLGGLGHCRLRVLGTATGEIWAAADEAGLDVDDTAVVGNGRVELRHWFREQALSIALHRYGNPITPFAAGVPGAEPPG